MVVSPEVVELSRLQFAVTALYHFLFLPLTLGLSWMLVIMEACFVITGKQIYKDMTRFWGKLFGINFAMGVVTGLTLEFQFGQNWAYFSQYIGNIFGVPLAIEGMVAFMLESTFIGIFFFGWDKVSKVQHLFATFFLAIGSSLSALVILVANGWMQNPVGATFNYHTLRMDLHSWSQLWLNPDAQVRFVHTIAAGFGLAATLSVIYLGDANGVEVATAQKAKLAAIEAEWTTAPAPAPWALVAWPNQKEQKNDFAVKLPWAMGVLITHSFDEKIEGLKPIIAENKGKIKRGMIAYGALQKLRDGDTSPTVLNTFKEYQDDLGYGLLLKRYTSTVTNATEAQITKAANGSIPNVPILFWSFRIMVASGFMILWIFILANVFWLRDTAWNKRWFLRLVLYSMPLPWIAAEMGWVVAEVGRQPWVVNGILPTFISILV